MPRRTCRTGVRAPLVLALVCVVLTLTANLSWASFSATTTNATNRWEAAASFTSTCTLTSTNDGYTKNYMGNTANGNGTTMYVADDGVSWHRSFVQFTVVGGTCAEGGTLPASVTVQSATLRLYLKQACFGCGGRPYRLRKVNQAWTEGALAYPGPTDLGSNSATFNAPSVDNTVDISGAQLTTDVQAFVNDGATNYGWKIEQNGGSSNNATPAGWGTHEDGTAGKHPKLVVVYR